MALPFGETPGARDAKTLSILARTIYRELRSSGYRAADVMSLAAELLAQVAGEVKARARGARRSESSHPAPLEPAAATDKPER